MTGVLWLGFWGWGFPDHCFDIPESSFKILAPGFWAQCFGIQQPGMDGVPASQVQGPAWAWGWGELRFWNLRLGYQMEVKTQDQSLKVTGQVLGVRMGCYGSRYESKRLNLGGGLCSRSEVSLRSGD